MIDKANTVMNKDMLINSEEKYSFLIENSPDVIYTVSNQGIYTYVSPACEQLLGYRAEYLLGKTFCTDIHQDDRMLCRNFLRKVLETGEKQQCIQYRIRHQDGSWVWHSSSAAPLKDASGNTVGLLGTIRDITELKKANQKLFDTAEEFERFFFVNPDLLCIADTQGRLLRVNKAWENTLGYPVHVLEGSKFMQFVHPDDIAKTLYVMRKLAKKEDVINFVNRYRCSDNTYKYIEWRSHPYGDLIYAAARDITERKTAELELKRIREFQDEAQGIAHIGSWERDYKTDTYFWSDESYQIYGVGTDFNITNESIMALRHPDDRDNAAIVIAESLHGKSFSEYEYRIVRPDGEIRHIHATRKMAYDELGNPLRGIGVIQDITERKQAELEIQRIQRNLEEAQSIAHIGSWERNLITNQIIWSDEAYRIYGLDPATSKMDFDTVVSMWHQDDRDFVLSIHQEMSRGKDFAEYEFRVIRPDSEIRTIHVIRRTIYDESGRAIRAIGTLQDVTEKKQAETAQQENERYLRTILETTHDGFLIVEQDGKIIDANDAYCNMSGYCKEELLRLHIWELIDTETEDAQDNLHKFTRAESQLFVARHRKKDGSTFDVEASVTCMHGDPVVFISFFRDISERKNAEELLLHSYDLMSYIIEHNRSAIAVLDKNLRYMYLSQRFLEAYKIGNKDIIGKHHYEVMPDLPENWKDVHQRALRGEVCSTEDDLYVHSDGSVEWSQWECRPWFEKDGSIGGIILYIEIINERKQLEKDIFNERELFKTTLLSVGDGVISTDNYGKIKILNPIAETLCGISQEEAIGKPLEEVFKTLHEFTRKPEKNPVKRILETGQIIRNENHTILVSATDREIAIEKNVAPIRDSEGKTTGIVIVFRDITEAREKQKQVEYLSLHDPLTGLYSRLYMEDAIKRLDTDRNLPFTIMVLDVNGLKLTNDAFGHEMGDRLLKTVAEIMTKTCRADDIICRIGGDEFAILLPKTNAEQAEAIKQRLFETTITTKLDSIMVSLAVGYSVKDTRDRDIMEIYKDADNHMYKNKMKYGKIMRSQTIETVLRNINSKYDREQIHTERVSQYCESIARALNLSGKEIEECKIAGILHDIGKIVVPAEVLNKPEHLNIEEREAVRRHALIGYQILKAVDEYAGFAEAVLYHHERWDGTGYPVGLLGDDIPLQARIIAVADAYEAMTAKRIYQKTKTKGEAREELIRGAGTQFDPEIIRVFVEKVI